MVDECFLFVKCRVGVVMREKMIKLIVFYLGWGGGSGGFMFK